MQTHLLTQPVNTEAGDTLHNIRVAYHTYGTLNPARDNVVWVLHALTGTSDAAQWWPEIVGEGKPIDPRKHFIICANMIGSCYGTTFESASESQPLPHHQTPVRTLLTTRDVVNVFSQLADELGIGTIELLIGGSMGGQQVLEWCIQQPHRINTAITIAANAQHSPWGIAFNAAQRMAIESGPGGLAVARAIGMISYRTHTDFTHKQTDADEKLTDYAAESYQRYQGQKLVDRFNAQSYHTLTRIMDSHNVGRGRGGVRTALASIRARTIVVGIDTDILFPIQEQELISFHVPGSEFLVMQSTVGHDAFLADQQQLAHLLTSHI